MNASGFLEIEHTADWELDVWAPDLERLLKQAAIGMYALIGARMMESPRQIRHFSIQTIDRESLLVEFLSELLYFIEHEGLGFDQFELSLQDSELAAECVGVPLESVDKEIKAVTFHNLKIQDTADGLRVRIVFDV